MKTALSYTLLLAIAITGLFFLLSRNHDPQAVLAAAYQDYLLTTSGAGLSLDAWVYERAYPHEKIDVRRYRDAFRQIHNMGQIEARGGGEDCWQSLGPQNVGGRTLCLAFHPLDTNIIYAGSASGGLWKTTTMGRGENAWTRVATGFPVLGVGAIAIDPTDPDVIYVGTGETYQSSGVTEPGTIDRRTRGTYGIGILKTIDGGLNWTQSLSFDQDDINGIQDIEISPQNPQEVYAAATDGMYRSLDGGEHWTKVFNQTPVIDIEIDPTDDAVIYWSQGNLNYNLEPNLMGIFKSTDKADSFAELLDDGLLGAWSGKTELSIHPHHPNIIYASIQVGWSNTGPTTPAGLYKSSDYGQNWTRMNNINVARFQGWYSHDVALHPQDTNLLIYVGIDTWRSTDGGQNVLKVSDWQKSTFGKIPVGTPEGPADYVHADIHAAYFHPLIEDRLFLATDGGVFMSEDAGLTFTTLNGGYQTTQFYPNFATSTTDPNFAIGGTQDNSTFIYDGTAAWIRDIGGDGMSAAINPLDDQVVYASAQGLFMLRSDNRADSFFLISPTLAENEFPAFSAPYELAPSEPSTVYAGAQFLYKSTDAGDHWQATSSQTVDGQNVIVSIAISHQDPNTVFVATSPNPFAGPATAKIRRSTNGGQSWTTLSGLPTRIAKDIAIDPLDDQIVYVVFSGFGTDHVFKSTDGGDNWTAIDGTLPDVPTNTILVDPAQTQDIYLGNDLGVFYSNDGGLSWMNFSEELPEATLVAHLSISPANRKIRVATHGNGVYERDLVFDLMIPTDEAEAEHFSITIAPNPIQDHLLLNLQTELAGDFKMQLYTASGQQVWQQSVGTLAAGPHHFQFGVGHLPAGTYFMQIVLNGQEKLMQQVVKI